MPADDLNTERQVLLAEHAELEEEHRRLQQTPKDLEGHRADSAKLQEHSHRLHALLERLAARRSDS